MMDLEFPKPPLELISYARSLVGLPYIWGAQDPRFGTDCSGLINIVHGKFGLGPTYDTTAQGLYNFHVVHGVGSFSEPGSLYFYGKHLRAITHVALQLSAEELIEAGGGDSKTTSIEVARAVKAMVRIKPLDHRKDLVAICMPNYSVAKVERLA